MKFFERKSEGNPSRSLPDNSVAAAAILKVTYEGNIQSDEGNIQSDEGPNRRKNQNILF